MKEVKPTIFKKFDATYSVSADGYCIRADTGFFMRPVVSDSREPFYQMATNGRKKRVSLRLAVATAWGKKTTVTDERAQEMRINADLWNSEERPGGKRKYNYEERRQWKKARHEHLVPVIDPMLCPWATGEVNTMPPGVKTWDCPEMDPLGCGTAKVMLKFETEGERRKTA